MSALSGVLTIRAGGEAERIATVEVAKPFWAKTTTDRGRERMPGSAGLAGKARHPLVPLYRTSSLCPHSRSITTGGMETAATEDDRCAVGAISISHVLSLPTFLVEHDRRYGNRRYG